ncbi:MAG: hypothetical protein U5L45_18830 [Saprospiraceae bacterium]|nr:hypothetical protein [Saprospiraceae bacterium]
MKSVKSTSDAPIYAQLLEAFDSAQSAYKPSKEQHSAAKQQLKAAEKRNASKFEAEVLKLQVVFAKHNHKAQKARLKMAQLTIKHWLKENEIAIAPEAIIKDAKKSDKKAKSKTEVVVIVETKKQGKKSKSKEEATKNSTEVSSVESVEVVKSKKRDNKSQSKVEVIEVTAIEKTEAAEPTKRSTKPRPKIEVEGAIEPKRRRRPARVAAIVEDEEDEEEEGVAGASARVMLAMDKEAVIEETVAEKTIKPVKAPKTEKVASDGKRGRRPSDSLAAEKAEKEAAIKAGFKGVDFRIIEGIGPKVTTILHDNGIVAFRDLAATNYDDLKALMVANRQFLVNPINWARQAQLAADGKMDELNALKAELFKGKEK